jgi:hypothetical protein
MTPKADAIPKDVRQNASAVQVVFGPDLFTRCAYA